MIREISLVLIALVYLLFPDGLSCRCQSCEWLARPMRHGNIYIFGYRDLIRHNIPEARRAVSLKENKRKFFENGNFL